MRGPRRRSVLRAAAGIATLVLLGAGSFALFAPRVLTDPDLNARPFDSEVWKAYRDHEPNPRYSMVGDLVRDVGLEGRTREEITGLLGPGDDFPNTWDLGPSDGFLESHVTYLTVEFGPDGRVKRVRCP